MFTFWWHIFWEALEHAFQTIGKEPSDICVSIFVFLIIGLFLIKRKGWPKGVKEVKERIPRVLGEDFAIVLCVFLFILAFHMAKDSYTEWRNAEDRVHQIEQQKESISKELEQEKDKSRPKFEIVVGSTIIGYSVIILPNGKREQHTHVFVPVTVYNHGAPSIIKNIRLMAEMKDGTAIEGENIIPGQKEIIFHDLNYRYSRDQALSLRGSANPIPTGGQCDGFAEFLFPFGIREKMRQTAKMKITIYDITGNSYQLPFDMSNSVDDVRTPPDMTQKSE
jgi:hypothetical protein